MRYNSTFSFVVQEKESDGMGGFIEIEKTGQSFGAFKQPVKAENVLKEYGFVTTKPFRVVTRKRLTEPFQSMILTDGSIKYKILEFLDLKYGIFLIEVID